MDKKHYIYKIKSSLSGTVECGSDLSNLDMIDLVDYGTEIRKALKDAQDTNLAEYLDAVESVISAVVDVEIFKNHQGIEELWAITTIKTTEPLNSDQMDALVDDLYGQFSDGFGEGFEQSPVADWYEEQDVESYDEEEDEYYTDVCEEKAELFIHLWRCKDYSIGYLDQALMEVKLEFVDASSHKLRYVELTMPQVDVGKLMDLVACGNWKLNKVDIK